MARPEKPIDSTRPAAEFARQLRALRQLVGLTYEQMAPRTSYSAATLSTAANGIRLPSWEVAAAYVSACGCDPGDWRHRWENAKQAEDVLTSGRTVDLAAVAAGDLRARRKLVGPPPIPLDAETTAAFLNCMKRLWIWAGKPALREIAKRMEHGGCVVSHVTVHNILTGSTMPKNDDFVIGFLYACAVEDQDAATAWVQTWARLKNKEQERADRKESRRRRAPARGDLSVVADKDTGSA